MPGTGGPKIPEPEFWAANKLTADLAEYIKLGRPCWDKLSDSSTAAAFNSCVSGLSIPDDEKKTIVRFATIPTAYTTPKQFQSPVRNQVGCNSCVSYAIVDNCETNWRKTSECKKI